MNSFPTNPTNASTPNDAIDGGTLFFLELRELGIVDLGRCEALLNALDVLLRHDGF